MQKLINILNKNIRPTHISPYLYCFLVPFVVLSISITYVIVQNERKEITRQNERSLESVHLAIYEKFSLLNTMAFDMSMNPVMQYLNYPKDEQLNEVEIELKQYAVLSQFVENIYLYYDKQEKIYSTTGTNDLSLLFSLRYKEEHINPSNFMANLDSNKPSFLPSKNFIFYFAPFNVNSNRIGRVIYVIPKNEFAHLVKDSQGMYQDTIVFFENQQLFVTSENKKIQQMPTSKKMQTGATDFLITQKKDKTLGLTMYSVTAKSYILDMVVPILCTVVGLLILFLVMGFITVFYISYKAYKPIAKLDKLYQQIVQESAQDEDLFESIGNLMVSQNTALIQDEWHLRQMKTSLFWEQLLTGVKKTLTQVKEGLEDIGRTYQGNIKYIVAIHSETFCTEPQQNLKIKSVLTFDLPIKRSGYQIDAIELIHQGMFAFVLQFDEMLEKKIQKDFLDYLEGISQAKVECYFGDCVENILNVHLSYISAQTKKKSYEKRNSSETVFPEKEMFTLLSAIRFAAHDLALQTINYLLEQGKRKNVSESYYYYILNGLLMNAQENQIELPEKALILDFSDLHNQFVKIANKMMDAYQENAREKKAALEQEILHIIHTHFADPQFSLEKLSTQFDVSLSKMSQMVKAETGNGFSKYVQNLRIEKAKELLLTTDLSIKEIVEQVGYTDLSNFTRKFRQSVGVPPGKFSRLGGKLP
ncbi:hypothetical protein A5844_001717 [Enterococcus sp. 10A9_DIV0425]|uniref:HTH araC/xylS-type domain-containing protein n=1 Tax=Candidatus Enterococcus wittei TaxID=1987383 RepID=A0A242JXS8_9ENTE|nr:AraC family transcriptional regulator [Enterococcus sp. 10A9_DIV0425]OTP10020.1 hypothetical protein A5844_001717 [Enterococcus sp. 10A9_DIV0425]THE12072.1 AraC family transcriptional regulator [Enterococcus hirae]